MKNSFSFVLKLRLPVVLAACAALLLFLLDRASEDSLVPATSESMLIRDYDYAITDMSTTRFNEDGQPAWHLQAERVTHYPDGDIARLEAPQLAYYSDTSPPWQVTAANGTLSPDTARGEDRLDLQGQVELRQSAADGGFLEITTPELTVYPDSQEAGTAADVVLQTADTHIDSSGMRALLEPQQIELLSNVRGVHVPPAHQP